MDQRLKSGQFSPRSNTHETRRDLGYTRYDKMAEALGCHAEYVEEPSEIRPALERAFSSGRPALVNVKTDEAARADTAKYTARDLVT